MITQNLFTELLVFVQYISLQKQCFIVISCYGPISYAFI